MVGGFGGGTDYGLILTPDDSSGYWNIANVTGGALTFNNSNTIGSSEAMRISGGKVTIGNTASVQPLTVAGNVLFRTTTADSFENRFQFIVGGSGDAGNFYVYDAAETAVVRLNGSGDSYINGGSLGIGTTSPDTLLNLEGGVNTSIITLGCTKNDASWNGERIGGINFYSADWDRDWETTINI